MKIGIIREGKVPPDSRVLLTPRQCAQLIQEQKLDIVVQPSEGRCFPDEAYRSLNIPMSNDLRDCDVLMGVKEAPIDQLIPDKTYFFFSHTIKEQPYNRKLLKAVIEKNIRLIDYEVLKDERGRRLIAFGRFAGMVGAHNGIMTYGNRTGKFNLPRMKDFHDYAAAVETYETMQFPPFRAVLTGNGRVGKGAAQVLDDMGIKKVSPEDYLVNSYDYPVYTQLICADYARRKDGTPFDKKNFYEHPELYESRFTPYTSISDIMINGIYWDNEAPVFFSLDDMRADDFNIQVIADVTCDIAPVASIPSTIKATTIAQPVFGFNPHTESEEAPYQEEVIDMMTIDNLPNELPRDASRAFGEQFIENILEELLTDESAMIERATVAVHGKLGMHFGYLENYLNHI